MRRSLRLVLLLVLACAVTKTRATTNARLNGRLAAAPPPKASELRSVFQQMSANVLIPLTGSASTAFTFPLLPSTTDVVSLWLLRRQTPQSASNASIYPDTLALYNPRFLPRVSELRAAYACVPDEVSLLLLL